MIGEARKNDIYDLSEAPILLWEVLDTILGVAFLLYREDNSLLLPENNQERMFLE